MADRMAKNAIGMAIACEEYGAKFFANGAAPSGVLEHPDRIPAEQGGDLYLINGNMTKLEDAGIFAADTSGTEPEDTNNQRKRGSG